MRKFPDFMVDVPSSISSIPFLNMRENDRDVSFFGKGTGRKIISVFNEWLPALEMNVMQNPMFKKIPIVFHVLAFALAKGLANLSITDQETKDILIPQMA
jgi:hypothetical protein